MKYVIIIIALLSAFMLGCASSQNNRITDLPPALQQYNQDMAAKEISPEDITGGRVRKVDLQINEMTCPSCALGVEYQLKQLPGVYNAEIKYPEGTGAVIYDSSQISAEEIAAASTIYPTNVVEDSLFNG